VSFPAPMSSGQRRLHHVWTGLPKKNPAECGVFCNGQCRGLLLDNILGRRAFRAVDNIKFYPGAFSKRFESLGLDGGMMDKYVLAAVLLNKTKTLRIIKPFNCTFCHFVLLLENRVPLGNHLINCPTYQQASRLAACLSKQKNRTSSLQGLCGYLFSIFHYKHVLHTFNWDNTRPACKKLHIYFAKGNKLSEHKFHPWVVPLIRRAIQVAFCWMMGSRMVNVVPWPGLLATSMLPPWRLMMP